MATRNTLIVTLLFTLMSCQREAGEIFQRPNDDALLIKSVTVSGTNNTDTTIITYDYDVNNRLAKETVLFNYITASGVQRLPIGAEYTRDGAGRITLIKRTNRLVSDPLTVISSFSTIFYVDNTSTKVAYITGDNNSFKTVFTYNTTGKIEKIETFQHFPSPNDPLKMTVYYLHQYDASGNLITRTQFSDNNNNGIFEQAISYAFEYDTKLNPVDKNDDALFESRWSLISPANCVKQTNKYGGGNPPDGFALAYQYRTDNKPEKATRTEFGGVLIGPAVTMYYYQ